jgi:hypothetical protein
MKAKTLTQPAIQTMEGVPSCNADDVSPHSSAIVGVTLLGDLDDVLACLRTAVLLARNLRATLFLGLPGKEVLPVRFSEAPCSTLVSELLDSARAQLLRLAVPTFAMEFNVIAASFVCAGSITMRVREFSSGAPTNLTK